MRIIGLALFLATSAPSASAEHAYLSPHADQIHYQSSHKLDTTTNRGHNSASDKQQQEQRLTKSNTNDNDKQQGQRTRLLNKVDPHHGQNGGHKGPRTTAAAAGGNTISKVSPVLRHTHVNMHHTHDGSHGNNNNNNERQSEGDTLSNAEMMALANESSSSGCNFCPNGLTTDVDTLIPTSDDSSEEEVSCGMALSFANSLNPQNDELDKEECDKVLLAELFCCPTTFVDELEEELTQDDQTPEDEVGTIVDAALGNDDFSKLVAALNAADLVDILNGDGPFTVFAPTNKAFDALPPGAFSDIDNLKSILTYHVIGGSEVDSSSLENGPVDTVNGEPIMITISDDGTVMVNDATVVTPDIRTSNGIIHAIDKVILPNGDLPSEVGTGTSDDEIEEELGSGPIACTLDVYTCPDGTTLGREGPDCEFPECPIVDASTTTAAVAGKASKAVSTKSTKVKKVHDPKADKSSPKKSADPSSTGKSGKTMDKSATPKATPPKKMSSKGNKGSKGLSMPVASTKSAKSMMFSKGAKNKSGLSMPDAPVKKGKSEKMNEDAVAVKSKGQKESDVKPKAEKVALSMPSSDQPFAKSSKLAKKGATDAMPKSSAKGDAMPNGSSKSGKGEVKKTIDAKAIKEAAGEKGDMPTSKTGKASLPKMSMPHGSAKTVSKASKQVAEKKAAGEKRSKGSGKSESKISTGAKSSKSIHTALDPVLADAKAKKVSSKMAKHSSKGAKHTGKSGKSGSTGAHPTVLPAASTEELVDTPATLPTPEEEAPIACTLDVFTCPDGTTLSREGPDCKFPECPEEPDLEAEEEEEYQEDLEEDTDESPDGTCHFCLDGLTAGADFELPTNGVFTCGQSADFAAKLDINDEEQAESCDIIQLAQAICCPSENDKDEDLPLLMESGLLDELSSGDE